MANTLFPPRFAATVQQSCTPLITACAAAWTAWNENVRFWDNLDFWSALNICFINDSPDRPTATRSHYQQSSGKAEPVGRSHTGQPRCQEPDRGIAQFWWDMVRMVGPLGKGSHPEPEPFCRENTLKEAFGAQLPSFKQVSSVNFGQTHCSCFLPLSNAASSGNTKTTRSAKPKCSHTLR